MRPSVSPGARALYRLHCLHWPAKTVKSKLGRFTKINYHLFAGQRKKQGSSQEDVNL